MTQAQRTFLIVDDKPNMLRLMSKVLKNDGCVHTAENGAEALRILVCEPIDAILCDLRMPDMDGLAVLQAAKRLRPQAEFVLMTAFASVGTAVEALKLGAYDYLTKPFEPENARNVLLRATLKAGLAEPAPTNESVFVLPGIVAQSAPMVAVAEMVKKVADSEVTALILGETGTGKERIARAVHELSPRRSARFVGINCAAIPPELLESELFGHAKGAFTGAVALKKGLFEEASGGTLFLDEVGDMLPSLQAKLTRVLEERTMRRVGEGDERAIDVRLIAATHRDLEAMVKSGNFREDLWYRLNVAVIQLPPLRNRPGDVKLLAQRFLGEQYERSGGKTPRRFDDAALDALLSYDWPGNVRQLRSATERACVVAEGEEVRVSDLPSEVLRRGSRLEEDSLFAASTWAEANDYGREQTARRYLEAVLRKFDGDISLAAKHADIERESFYRLLRKHQVDPGEFRTNPRGAKR